MPIAVVVIEDMFEKLSLMKGMFLQFRLGNSSLICYVVSNVSIIFWVYISVQRIVQNGTSGFGFCIDIDQLNAVEHCTAAWQVAGLIKVNLSHLNKISYHSISLWSKCKTVAPLKQRSSCLALAALNLRSVCFRPSLLKNLIS